MGARETYEVDPARLEPGGWAAAFNRSVAGGDIAESYSGDTIGLKGTVRTPFFFAGEPWVSVGSCAGVVQAYRLMPVDQVQDEAASFEERAADGDAARDGPNGFYHGVTVRYRSDWFVLYGPPALFVAGAVVQPGLFGD